jgi:hypothetical protein
MFHFSHKFMFQRRTLVSRTHPSANHVCLRGASVSQARASVRHAKEHGSDMFISPYTIYIISLYNLAADHKYNSYRSASNIPIENSSTFCIERNTCADVSCDARSPSRCTAHASEHGCTSLLPLQLFFPPIFQFLKKNTWVSRAGDTLRRQMT